MPPKRKNKATKATSATPFKAPPAAMRTSSGSHAKRTSLSSKPSSASRLLPSEPFHMSTRRAAKTASNHTSSGAPSIASSSSRRSSLDDFAQYRDAHSDIEDERPAKRTRLSTDSGSPRVSAASFNDQVAVNGTQTPDSQNVASRSASVGPRVPSKKRRASDESSQSSKTVSARANGVLTRTQSDISELQPRRKKRRTTQAPADFADQPPELTDASTAPNSPEQIAEVEGLQNLHHVLPTNGEAPAKMGKRLPGRRRAPHADVNVETDLRRQLNLKMSYRSLAKIQKNILEELSSRATNDLDNDPEYYKRCPEYEPLMAALDQHKESRLSQINAVRTNKLEQLERVRIATEHIEKEKYVQRFKDVQEDLLLQCFYRMKQFEREMKGEDGTATDDEDNIIAATHLEFPALGEDERLGSKFASRSRAYVETDRLLNEELRRKRFDQSRTAFVAADEDADDSIDDIPNGFGTFVGPDRTEAIAHWNLVSLADAAEDVETMPPQPIVPNEQHEALFLLASLSADAPRGTFVEKKQPEHEEYEAPNLVAPESPPPLYRELSPNDPQRHIVHKVLLSSPSDSPAYEPPRQDVSQRNTPDLRTNGVPQAKEPEVPKTETPVRSTHRIMDILNDDTEVPVPRSRESLPPIREQTPAATPSRRVSMSQGTTPLRSSAYGLETIVHQQPLYPERISSRPQTASLPPPSDGPPPSPSTTRYAPPEWRPRMSSYGKGMSEESLRRRDPLNAIRAMLDSRASVEGKPSQNQRHDGHENMRKSALERERGQTAAVPLSRPFSPSAAHDRQEATSQGTRRTSVGYGASPSLPPISYNQSPSMAPAYPPPRHSSQDIGASQWERDRRLSGSQAPPPPAPSSYAGSPPQPHPIEHHQPGPNPPPPPHPPHHSPYSTPSAPQLPSISQSLQSKQPGPPSSGPINFRFAHYDPAPPRPAYPSPSPSGYPPTSHPPPQSAPPPPPQYGSGYSAAPYQGGYVPPPGSFQAPPPPPPPLTSNTPYPPLKIHQYGGQPILPANMAPPPQSQTPYMGQAGPQPAYSPPQQNAIPQRTPSYDQQAPPPRDPSAERPSEGGQSRQRRQYRSYHAPGTQFRSYQGPDSSRRRGG